MMRMKVGQVIYILNAKTREVLPGRVITENKQKTLTGTVVTYEVEVRELAKQGVNVITVGEADKDTIFDSTRKVKEYLMAQVARSFDVLIAKAEKIAAEHFSDEKKVSDDDDDDDDQVPKPATAFKKPPSPSGMQVQLENGMIANVHIGEPRVG
jgi:hypothetical protein